MKRILFLFNPDGDLFRIIEDADGISHYDKTVFVYGYDRTKIACFNRDEIGDEVFIDLRDNETIDYSELKTKWDIERFKYNQWKTAQEAAKIEKIKQAQNDYDFLESRHDRLLELIAYTEKQLDAVPYFSKEWEKIQRKIITLENQLRTVDKKREKAFSIIHG